MISLSNNKSDTVPLKHSLSLTESFGSTNRAQAHLNLAEAVSTSYLLHCTAMMCCAILAMSLLAPRPKPAPVIYIDLVPSLPQSAPPVPMPSKLVLPKADLYSDHNEYGPSSSARLSSSSSASSSVLTMATPMPRIMPRLSVLPSPKALPAPRHTVALQITPRLRPIALGASRSPLPRLSSPNPLLAAQALDTQDAPLPGLTRISGPSSGLPAPQPMAIAPANVEQPALAPMTFSDGITKADSPEPVRVAKAGLSLTPMVSPMVPHSVPSKLEDITHCPLGMDFGPYMSQLDKRIKLNWYPPKHAGKVVVLFTISKDGAVSKLRIDKSCGLAIGDRAALEAVERAAPFSPLPQCADSSVDIQYTFDYTPRPVIFSPPELALDRDTYMTHLQRQIERNWYPPKDGKDGTMVTFTLSKTGTVNELNLSRPSGCKICDEACLKAIENAAPFVFLPNGSNNLRVQYIFVGNPFVPLESKPKPSCVWF